MKQTIVIKVDEYFIGKILKIGNSLGVVIPKRNLEFSGLKKGDGLKLYYEKEKQKKKQVGENKMLYIDNINKIYGGMAKARDIKEKGLIKACEEEE